MMSIAPSDVPLRQRQPDRRAGTRQKLVLRIGLLELDGRSIFCLVKNISSAGVQIKPYGRVELQIPVALRVGDEDPIDGKIVWMRDGLAGIEFDQKLNPQTLLRIGQKMVAHKRRSAPRVATGLQANVRTAGSRHSVTVCDLSMLGARLRSTKPIAFGEHTILELAGLPQFRAFLRWSDGNDYGVSFETAMPMQIIADLIAGDQQIN
ncbi:PilZ domain-containing protein [Sphingomonas piscis]|uniref:PilZ domain-containing protein n=1 Tax=Sphingomonas piscis TaxID=2714943 RepID=A0A6G7YSB7_9SPHN|nr:PilZ domain-containing protein [Sphingomonas piscis]QIK79636.1 PilZ domain-containing protein [Sphingomonas piscis]